MESSPIGSSTMSLGGLLHCKWKALHFFVCLSRHTATSSVDTQEIEKFSALANQWWDPRGPFAALHEMNGVRVPLVKEVARADLQHYGQVDDLRSLSGLKILDVGCGGGILSEVSLVHSYDLSFLFLFCIVFGSGWSRLLSCCLCMIIMLQSGKTAVVVLNL